MAALALVLAACAARPEVHVATTPPIREVSAPKIREVSMASAGGVVWSRLPAPHLVPLAAPAIREPADLRRLVGLRDRRDPFAIVVAWVRDLDGVDPGDALLAWAERTGRLAARTEVPAPGDLLVFDRTDSDREADLVAVAIGRDDRGVTEFVYCAGGVIRRGFVDVAHPARRRDRHGDVLNTYLRAGKRWPPKGTHYLAGELLGHIVRVR